MSRARWFIAVGLSVSCVPVDHLTIPDDVDWLAFVGVQVEGYEDGRLYPADDVDTIVTPDEGWLVGYRNEQLANEYFPPEQLRRVSVRFARPSEAWLPDPVWTRSFGGPRPLGGLTAARLGLKAPEVTLPAPLRVESSLEIIDRGGLEAVGQARNGAFLLVFADRTVHEVSTYRTRLLSEHNCSEDVRSVARYGPQYRITTAGLDVCEGVDLLQLEKKPLCREGAFHIDGFLQWLFVGTNGDVLQVEYNGSVPCTGRSADAWSGFQVSNDLSGYLIATGNTWNLHERLGSVRRDLPISSPFAAIPDAIVFQSDDNVLRMLPHDQEQSLVFSAGPADRDFGAITSIALLDGHIVVAERDTNLLFWVDTFGYAIEFFSVGYPVSRLLVAGNMLIAVGRKTTGDSNMRGTALTRVELIRD